MTPAEIHNRDVAEIIRSIGKPTLDAGGSITDVLVLLESVCAGVLTISVGLGGDNDVLDVFMGRLRERMANIRLSGIEPKGNA